MYSRYNPHPINMRYASPDSLRPNSNLLARAHQNFGNYPYPKGPPPSQLPMPSLRLRNSEQSPPKQRSPRQQIKGINRTWTVKSHKSS